MKKFKEFLLEKETAAMSIEHLAGVCKKLVKDISDKIDIPIGLIQQGIVLMDKPFPHIHCQAEIIKDGLEKDNQFLCDEVCGMFKELAKESGLNVVEVKKGDDHGQIGDLLAKVEITQN